MNVVTLPPDPAPVSAPGPAPVRDRRVIMAAVVALVILVTGWRAEEGWWERMWDVVLPLIWGIALIRLLAIRATLPMRAVAGAMVLGILSAISLAPIAAKLANPYDGNGEYYVWFGTMARLAALVVPIAIMIVTGRVYRVISVADGFLLGFAAGFGFDLIPLLIAADAGRLGYEIDYFPPLQYLREPRSYPGTAYWTGFVTLTLVALLRFRRAVPNWPPIAGHALVGAGTVLVFLWCATESVALASGDPEGWWVLRFGREGSLTAFVVLGSLIALSWIEHRLGSRAAGERWRTDLSGAAAAAAKFDLRDAARAMARMRLRAQIAAVEADPDSMSDQEVRAYARGAAIRLQQLDGAHEEPAAAPTPRWWRDPRIVHTSGWLAFVAVLLLIPKVERLATFWTLPVIHAGLGTTAFTLFTAALAALVVSRLVRSRPGVHRPADAGAAVEFRVEKTVLGIGFAIATMIAFYPLPAENFPLYTFVPGQTILPNRTAPMMMLIALAATGVAAARTNRWLREPDDVRRAGVVRQSLLAVVGTLLGWLTITVYPAVVAWLHARFGPTLKPFFLARYGNDQEAGFGVSNTLAAGSVVVVVLLGIAAAWAFHRWSRRVERFLIGADSPAGSR